MTVAAVGDLMLGDSAICVGYGLRSRYSGEGADTLFDGVKHLLAGADMVFGNLETVLSHAGLDPLSLSSAQMRGDPSFAGVLRRAGFDVLSVANNHADQHGADAFAETVALLRAEGIACCGLRGTGAWCSEPVLLDRGARVGVLAYSLRPRQYGSATPPYAEGSSFEILADVRRLRATVDHVVVSLHWGEEFVARPSADEVTLGRALVDTGAALVIGHHPHVVRPVERHRAGVVAYSLGNFAADMVWQPRLREGAVLRCRLTAGGVEGVEVVGTRIGPDFRPVPSGERQEVEAALGAGMPAPEYRRAVARTVRAQQLASYAYALANAWRYPRPILAQLVTRTIRNKFAGLVPLRSADR
ncbi:MAG TPA: CapA family protein [Longimicrobiaceae bacterium]|nr:CapA family protein [Longimicrobiaceae bacterium]